MIKNYHVMVSQHINDVPKDIITTNHSLCKVCNAAEIPANQEVCADCENEIMMDYKRDMETELYERQD